MSPVRFTHMLRTFTADSSAHEVKLTDDWLQGRTAYGGLTTALCLESVLQKYPQLPPIRSAQVSFIGPAIGLLKVSVKMVRQGKSVAFVEADLTSEKGLATRCLFTFGQARQSKLTSPIIHPSSLVPPEQLPVFVNSDQAPAFTQHYETRVVSGQLPGQEGEPPDYLVWVRHRDPEAMNTPSGLLAIADMLPPAMFATMSRVVPASSITWHLNILVDDVPKSHEWYLLRSTAENAHVGYSSQDMWLWDRTGRPLVCSRQLIGIFEG